MAKANRKTISEQFYNSAQSWHYSLVVSAQVGVTDRKFKVVIRRNAYDDQSSIKGFIYAPNVLAWNELVHRPMTKAATCYPATYVRATESKLAFETDALSVIEEMKKIVG